MKIKRNKPIKLIQVKIELVYWQNKVQGIMAKYRTQIGIHGSIVPIKTNELTP